jgi:hypothetical protein
MTARRRDALKPLLAVLLFGGLTPSMTLPKVKDRHRSISISCSDSRTISASVFKFR